MAKEKSVDTDMSELNAIPALCQAAQKGEQRTLLFLLEQSNQSINQRAADGSTALHFACMENQIGCAKILIFYGANLFLANHKGKLPTEVLPESVQKSENEQTLTKLYSFSREAKI